jgi:integrase
VTTWIIARLRLGASIQDPHPAGLAPKTINNHLLTLRVMLKPAGRWRLLRSNPMVDAERPRVEDPYIRVPSQEEIAALSRAYEELESEADEEKHPWWRLARTISFVALGTAIRRGELLTLRWRDVSMLERLVHVREALVRGPFTTLKSRRPGGSWRSGSAPRNSCRSTGRRASSKRRTTSGSHPEKGRPLDPSRLAHTYLKPALRKA